MNIDNQYKLIVDKVQKEGYRYEMNNRKGTFVTQIDSYSFTHDMRNGFPLLSLKKTSFHNIMVELNWFLSGQSSIKFLKDRGVKIWDKDVANYEKRRNRENPDNEAGRVYGVQWRDFSRFSVMDSSTLSLSMRSEKGLDQIQNLINKMRDRNVSRRGIVTAWHPIDVAQDKMALPPCHFMFQVIENPTAESFSLKWHQRSCDLLLGIPYNIASYALLGRFLEARTGMKFTHLIADLSCVHIYDQHTSQMEELISRDSLHDQNNLVDVSIDTIENGDCIWWNLHNYKSHGYLKAEMIAEDK